MMSQYERELKLVENDFFEGNISAKEYNEQIREIERDYREMARESAQDAHERELDRW